MLNSSSSTISSYAVSGDGSLHLIDPEAAILDAGAFGVALATTPDGRLLYALDSAGHSLFVFRVEGSGRLDRVDRFVVLPEGMQGLAVR
ncbi:MAG: hypothetical protein ACK4S4_09875 [Pyrinomonadaceae bacterium]